MTAATTIRARIRRDLTPAMRDRDMARVRALRSALGAIDNAEAVPTRVRAGAVENASVGAGSTEAARRELTEDDVREVLRQEVDEHTPQRSATNDRRPLITESSPPNATKERPSSLDHRTQPTQRNKGTTVVL